jgi:hypothetical protein
MDNPNGSYTPGEYVQEPPLAIGSMLSEDARPFGETIGWNEFVASGRSRLSSITHLHRKATPQHSWSAKLQGSR